MKDWTQRNVPCCGCGGPHEGTFVLIDLTPEGRGEHYPICWQTGSVTNPDGTVEPVAGCVQDAAHITLPLPSRYKIVPRRALEDTADPAHRGGPRV